MVRRILKWCLRILDCYTVLGLINSIKVFIISPFTSKYIHLNLPGGRTFYFRGKYDRNITSHFYQEGYFIKDCDDEPITKIIDCGAYIGDETIRFLYNYPNAEIIAVEAESENFKVLEKNLEGVPRVHVLYGAIWPENTNLSLNNRINLQAFQVVESPDQSISIPVWKIQDILSKFGWNEIDILKLDIEGSELKLFSTNYQDWIEKVNAFIFEVPDNDQPGATQTIYKALGSRSFNTHICGENLILIRESSSWSFQKVFGFEVR